METESVFAEIEALKRRMSDLEDRFSALEVQTKEPTCDAARKELASLTPQAVIIREDGVPVYNRVIAGSRREQQCQAILLLMNQFRRQGEVELTSDKISKALFRGGVPTERIDAALSSLRSSLLINSKPNQRTIFLTPDGEREAGRLEQTLPVKG